MSNIGKNPIKLPSNYTLLLKDFKVFKQLIISTNSIKKYINFPSHFNIEVKENFLYLTSEKKDPYYGTLNKKILQMLTPIYKRQLMLTGIGYKLEVKDDEVISDIGYSHKLTYKIPNNIKVKEIKNNLLEAESDSLEDLMSFLSKI